MHHFTVPAGGFVAEPGEQDLADLQVEGMI